MSMDIKEEMGPHGTMLLNGGWCLVAVVEDPDRLEAAFEDMLEWKAANRSNYINLCLAAPIDPATYVGPFDFSQLAKHSIHLERLRGFDCTQVPEAISERAMEAASLRDDFVAALNAEVRTHIPAQVAAMSPRDEAEQFLFGIMCDDYDEDLQVDAPAPATPAAGP